MAATKSKPSRLGRRKRKLIRPTQEQIDRLRQKSGQAHAAPRTRANDRSDSATDTHPVVLERVIREVPLPGQKGEQGDPGVGLHEIEFVGRDLVLWRTDGRGWRLNNFKPKDGEPGKQGNDGTGIEDVQVVDGNLVTVLTNGEVRYSGKIAGRDGDDGVGLRNISLRGELLCFEYEDDHEQEFDLRALIDNLVKANIPKPIPGKRGLKGKRGLRGLKGTSGRGLKKLVVDGDKLIAKYTDGKEEEAGTLPEKIVEIVKTNATGIEDIEFSKQRRAIRWKKKGKWTSWIKLLQPVGGGIADAPEDNTIYGRKNGAWAAVESGGITSVFGRTTPAITAQASDYAEYYDSLGTASGLMASHLSSFAHADIALNTTHRGLTSGNPHNVLAADVGADPAGTAAAGDAAHLAAFTHADIALNTSARHTRLHSVTGALDHTFPGGTDYLRSDGTWQALSFGDVVGPASATGNAICRFDSTTGKLIQNSAVTIADTTGLITTPSGLTNTTSALLINDDGAQNVHVGASSPDGTIPEFRVYGYRATKALEYVSIAAGLDNTNTVSFGGSCQAYRFTDAGGDYFELSPIASRWRTNNTEVVFDSATGVMKFQIKGKSGSRGEVDVYGNNGSDYVILKYATFAELTTNGDGLDLHINSYVNSDITCFANAASGETPSLKVSGYPAGTSRQTVSMYHSADGVFLFEGTTDVDRFSFSHPVTIADPGSLLATPVAGTLEFDNDRVYLTNVGTQRAIDRTSDVVTSTTTVSNTTTETTVFTGSVPANSLKAGNILKLYVDGVVSTAAAADQITLRIKIGGTTVATATATGSVWTNACWHGSGAATLRSVGATGSMAWHFDLDVSGTNTAACGISTVDTAASADVTVTVQWNNAKAGNSISLHQGFMEYKN